MPYPVRNLYIDSRLNQPVMPHISQYKRSKKLYKMGEETFVKPRHWPETIDIEGTVLVKEDPIEMRGEIIGYNYVVDDYGSYDPSIPDGDVYGWDEPPVNKEGYVSERNWPSTIDLPDGTVLTKAWQGKPRYAYYFVESWGDNDPSVPSCECYEGEFEKPYPEVGIGSDS